LKEGRAKGIQLFLLGNLAELFRVRAGRPEERRY
jgi:hypothetical protein